MNMTQCPLEVITRDTWDVIEAAGFYEKGLPPVAGGMLDQAWCFAQAARFVWAEERNWKRKLRITTD